MKSITSFVLSALLLFVIGCGSAEVEGKPALQADTEQSSQQAGGGSSGGGDLNQYMLMQFDKNKDGKIEPSEFPDGGLDGYDADGDGTITTEELKKRNKEILKKGLGSIATNPDEDAEVVK